MKSQRLIGLGMVLIVLSWGFNYVITKIGVTHISPTDFVFWRFLGTAIFALPWMLKSLPKNRRDGIGLLVMGLVGVSLYQWLFTTALHLTLSANVAFLFNLSPLLTLLFQRLIGRTVLGKNMWWGAGLSFFGVALLAGASLHGGLAGDLLAVLAAGAWSAFALITDRLHVSIKGIAQTGWISLFGVIGVLPFTKVEAVWTLGVGAWLPLLYTIFLVTLMGLSLWQNAVASLGAARASLMLYFIPLVAAGAGWLILGERMTVGEGVGAIAILAGVAWADGRLHRTSGRPPLAAKTEGL